MTIKVLLVEDHLVVSEGLKLLLERQPDIKVIGEASNGSEAIQMIKQTQPDIVLMDIAMPGLNGIESTRRILGDYPSVKVVILSMHSSSEHIFRALQAGALGYLLKEFRRQRSDFRDSISFRRAALFERENRKHHHRRLSQTEPNEHQPESAELTLQPGARGAPVDLRGPVYARDR